MPSVLTAKLGEPAHNSACAQCGEQLYYLCKSPQCIVDAPKSAVEPWYSKAFKWVWTRPDLRSWMMAIITVPVVSVLLVLTVKLLFKLLWLPMTTDAAQVTIVMSVIMASIAGIAVGVVSTK